MDNVREQLAGSLADHPNGLREQRQHPKWGHLANSDRKSESPWTRKVILSLGKLIARFTSGECCLSDEHDRRWWRKRLQLTAHLEKTHGNGQRD